MPHDLRGPGGGLQIVGEADLALAKHAEFGEMNRSKATHRPKAFSERGSACKRSGIDSQKVKSW